LASAKADVRAGNGGGGDDQRPNRDCSREIELPRARGRVCHRATILLFRAREKRRETSETWNMFDAAAVWKLSAIESLQGEVRAEKLLLVIECSPFRSSDVTGTVEQPCPRWVHIIRRRPAR